MFIIFMFLKKKVVVSTGGLRVEWSPATRSIRVRVPASAILFVLCFFELVEGLQPITMIAMSGMISHIHLLSCLSPNC